MNFNLNSSLVMLGIGLSLGLCLNSLAGQTPLRAPRTLGERKVFLNELSDSVNKVVVNHEEQVRSSQALIERVKLLESRLDGIRRAANGYRRGTTTIEQLLSTIESNRERSGTSSEQEIARLKELQRLYELLSNIMKARHETAKNIIQNIRA